MAEVVIIDSKFRSDFGEVQAEIYVSGTLFYGNYHTKPGIGTKKLEETIASKINQGFMLVSQSSSIGKQGSISSTYTLVKAGEDLIKL